MTLDEDTIQIDEMPTQRFRHDDATSTAGDAAGPVQDPWAELDAALKKAAEGAFPDVRFRLDESYTRKLMDLSFNRYYGLKDVFNRNPISPMNVSNYNLRNNIIPITRA
jgi:hypothetical protein